MFSGNWPMRRMTTGRPGNMPPVKPMPFANWVVSWAPIMMPSSHAGFCFNGLSPMDHRIGIHRGHPSGPPPFPFGIIMRYGRSVPVGYSTAVAPPGVVCSAWKHSRLSLDYDYPTWKHAQKRNGDMSMRVRQRLPTECCHGSQRIEIARI